VSKHGNLKELMVETFTLHRIKRDRRPSIKSSSLQTRGSQPQPPSVVTRALSFFAPALSLSLSCPPLDLLRFFSLILFCVGKSAETHCATFGPLSLSLSLSLSLAAIAFGKSSGFWFWVRYKDPFLRFFFLPEMAGETSWVAHCPSEVRRAISVSEEFSENLDKGDSSALISLDSVLPDDLLERILANLPTASIFRAGSVCKRWSEIVNSKRFMWNLSNVVSHKPWYFMFTDSSHSTGYSYDPVLRKWHSFELPCIVTSSWFIASSCGLVCFMDNQSSQLFVCNPITKAWRQLEEPPALNSSPDYNALAMSVNRKSREYVIAVVKSKQVPQDFIRWDTSIHVYDSDSGSWVTPATEVLIGWRGGNASVICNGVLYFLIYSTCVMGGVDNRHGLIMYDLSRRSSHASLMGTSVLLPRSLTCGRLMNLKEKLVMVGGIGKPDRPDIIKGIGIWVLDDKEWQEIARMPHKCFQGFGELDDVFSSSGADDLIYIQSYGAPLLLTFDMNLKQWKWSQKCPVSKRFPLQLFTGFSFEPRLERKAASHYVTLRKRQSIRLGSMLGVGIGWHGVCCLGISVEIGTAAG
ncbi:hypothetical protein ACLOJK_010154, partial [Asimina triloba]